MDISRPVNRRELIALVGRDRPGAQQAAQPSPIPISTWSSHAMIDRLGGDRELTLQLVSLFLAECPRMMSAIRESVAGGSADEIRRAAHAFKGSVGNFTDTLPTTTAAELEQLGREGRVVDGTALLARLEHEVDEFERQLRQFEREASCAS